MDEETCESPSRSPGQNRSASRTELTKREPTAFELALQPWRATGLAREGDTLEKEIQHMERHLLQRSQATMEAAGSFSEIVNDQGELLEAPPDEWFEVFGERGAWQRFKIAKMAMLPNAKAPFALHSAQKIVTGFIKSRGHQVVHNNLNIGITQLPEPAPVGEPSDTPIIEVTGE